MFAVEGKAALRRTKTTALNIIMKTVKMKAVVCTEYGPPDVLRISEVDKPVPKSDEVLIRVRASAVNSGDVRVRGLIVNGFLKLVMRFVLGFNKPRNPVLGTVLAGTVEEVGNSVKSFRPGDAVFASTGMRFGAYADYITVKEDSPIALKPRHASFEEAAVLPFGGMTALYFLLKAKIKEMANPVVLIYGATGSVGSSAVQIAKYFGAEVTSVCSDQGAALAQQLGSDYTVVYNNEDFRKMERQFDIIFDAVGKINKGDCIKLLKKGGRFLTVGALDVADEKKEYLDLIRELYEKKSLKAVLEKTYPLEEIVEAHRHVELGRKKGNVAITI